MHSDEFFVSLTLSVVIKTKTKLNQIKKLLHYILPIPSHLKSKPMLETGCFYHTGICKDLF